MSKRDEFLRDQKVLRLATISRDNTPHIAPVWYMYSDKKFYIGTNTKTQKAKNVKNNKHVCCCVDVGVNSPDIYGVLVHGEASVILEESRVKEIAEKILLRYFETLDDKSARQLLGDTDCIIEVAAEKFTVWDY